MGQKEKFYLPVVSSLHGLKLVITTINQFLRKLILDHHEHHLRVFSDVLVAFLYFDIRHYRQSNLAYENPEFSQPVLAGLFQ